MRRQGGRDGARQAGATGYVWRIAAFGRRLGPRKTALALGSVALLVVTLAGLALATGGSAHPASLPLLGGAASHANQLRWSSAATWDGRPPSAGAAVVIPSGKTVLLDVSPPPLKSLEIDGALVFAEADLALTSGWIMVHGRLEIGSEAAPFAHKATITLTAPESQDDIMGMGTKVLGVMGGTLDLHGQRRLSWTRLAATATRGVTQLTLAQAPDWQVGDQLTLASTDFNPQQAEQVTVAGVSGATVTLTRPLAYTHWGALQTFAGQTLDERAELGLLSHNIVIQGDGASTAHGFGGHLMVMSGGAARIEGVEFFRMGQEGHLARYPIHFHLLGDAEGSYAKGNSIHQSYNRCVTIHGTNKLLVQDNVAFDTIGHCYFMEDGVETQNTIEHNLGVYTRKPADGRAVLPSDTNPATYWVTNPNNILRGNVAAGSQGVGFWYALPQHPTGLSKSAANDAAVWPQRTPLGEFSGNVAHSNEDTGLNVDNGPKPDGTTDSTVYTPRQNPADEKSAPAVAQFQGLTAYKNRTRGAWLRGSDLRLVGATLADNLIGATFANGEVLLQHALLIGETANKGTPQSWEKTGLDGRALPHPWEPNFPIRGYEFYDGKVGAEHVTFVNYQPNSLREASGLGYNRQDAFPVAADNYVQDVRFVNANSVYLENPLPDHDGDKQAIFQDGDGSLTGAAGQYVVVNNPLLLDGACSAKSEWNAYICGDRYIGFSVGADDGANVAPLVVSRDDGATMNEVGPPYNPRSVYATLLSKRAYTLTFTGGAPTRPRLYLNGAQTGDWARIALPYASASFIAYRNYDRSKPLIAAGSLAALDAGAGDTYYYDGASHTLYVKLVAQPGQEWATLFVDPR